MIKTGDIILVNGTSIVSRIIKFITKSKYSHVALAISDSHVVEIDWKYRVQVRTIQHKHFDVYRLNRDLTTEEIFMLLNYSYSLIGLKYDFLKIFSLLIEIIFKKRGKRLFNNPKKLICSDIVDSGYKRIGVDLVSNFNEQDTTPDDISKSNFIVFVESVKL